MTLKMCCSSSTIVVFFRGQFWWRRHKWLGDVWAPLGLPGGGVATVRPKPRRAAHRRAVSMGSKLG